MRTILSKISRCFAVWLIALLVPGLGCSYFAPPAAGQGPEQLAPASTPAQPASAPTSDPAAAGASARDLKIVDTSSWVRDGYLYIYAVLQNHSSQWLKASVNITLYDKNGQALTSGAIIGKALAPALPGNIPPGGWAIIEHSEELNSIGGGSYDHFEFTSLNFEKQPASPEMQVSAIQFDQQTPFANFSGSVTNTGSQDCLDPMIIAIGYTADGKIFSTLWLLGDAQTLAPGQTWEFQDSLDNPSGEVQQIKVIAGCGAFHDN